MTFQGENVFHLELGHCVCVWAYKFVQDPDKLCLYPYGVVNPRVVAKMRNSQGKKSVKTQNTL